MFRRVFIFSILFLFFFQFGPARASDDGEEGQKSSGESLLDALLKEDKALITEGKDKAQKAVKNDGKKSEKVKDLKEIKPTKKPTTLSIKPPLNGEALSFLSSSLSLFDGEPLAFVYFDGLVPFLDKVKVFLHPMIPSILFDKTIAKGLKEFSEFFGKNFSSLKEFLSFMGLSPKISIFAGVFKSDLKEKGKLPYNFAAFVSLSSKKNFLNFLNTALKIFNEKKCRRVQRKLQRRLKRYLKGHQNLKGKGEFSEEEILKHVLGTKIPQPCEKLKWVLVKEGTEIAAQNWSELEKFSKFPLIYQSDRLVSFDVGEGVVLSVTDKLAVFSLSMDKKLPEKFDKNLSQKSAVVAGLKHFIHPLRAGDIYGYLHLGQLFQLSKDVVDFAPRKERFGSSKGNNLIKMAKQFGPMVDFFSQMSRGVEQNYFKFSVGNEKISLISSLKYGEKRSKFVEKLFKWRSKPLASKSLLSPNTVFLLSLNHLELLLSLYKDILDSSGKNIEHFLPPDRAVQLAMFLPIVSASLEQAKKYLKGELTVAVSYSEHFMPQVAIFISSPDPSNTLKTLSPFIFKALPQFTSKTETHRGVSFSVLKRNPNASKNVKPLKFPLENRLAWGVIKDYAVITYQIKPGFDFIKSIIDRAFSSEKKASNIQKLLDGNIDFSLLINFESVYRFFTSSDRMKLLFPFSDKVKEVLRLFSYILFKSENKANKFYQYELILKKSKIAY